MNGIPLSTAFDQPIAAWLSHQRALGRDYGTEEHVLETLKRFVARLPVPDLDQASFELWRKTLQHLDASPSYSPQSPVYWGGDRTMPFGSSEGRSLRADLSSTL